MIEYTHVSETVHRSLALVEVQFQALSLIIDNYADELTQEEITKINEAVAQSLVNTIQQTVSKMKRARINQFLMNKTQSPHASIYINKNTVNEVPNQARLKELYYPD